MDEPALSNIEHEDQKDSASCPNLLNTNTSRTIEQSLLVPSAEDEKDLPAKIDRPEVKEHPQSPQTTVITIDQTSSSCLILAEPPPLPLPSNESKQTNLIALLALPRSNTPSEGFAATWGQPSFELFHPTVTPPARFSGLGFHTHPHLGVYGDTFLPFFPSIALSLPATPTLLSSARLGLSQAVLTEILADSTTQQQHDDHSDLKVMSKVEYYFLLHSGVQRGPCQKFICSRDDEINLMLHPFVFQDSTFTSDLVSVRKARVGLFAPEGVFPAHLDLQDGGVPFHQLEERTVAIHDQSFSPCNMHIRLDFTKEICYFVTVVSYEQRWVVTLHAVPTAPPGQNRNLEVVSTAAQEAATLGELVDALRQGGEGTAMLLVKLKEFIGDVELT